MNEIDERVIQLEIRFTYLEEKFESLNTVLIEKNSEIEILKQKIHKLENSISDYFEIPTETKPPHY
jgi:uncharacterized coiled-coil protein SlyX